MVQGVPAGVGATEAHRGDMAGEGGWGDIVGPGVRFGVSRVVGRG